MKQRIRVTGIIRSDEGVLVLKRSYGRAEGPTFWELPTGKIKLGEQPEEAMARVLMEYTNLKANSLKVKDVITFLANEGSSRLSNLYIVYDISIAGNTKPTPIDRYSSYKYIKDFTTSNIRLDEASSAVLEIAEGKSFVGNTTFRETANATTINVDGASRGNPGPSGIGYCITDQSGNILERSGEFIGFATSRVAEYYAMRRGIDRAIELGYKTVHFISDSLMVVNQLNGIFSVKNQDVFPIYNDIQSKLSFFEAISFTHVPRSENAIADSEANLAIDKILKE